jgi:hypothetical protein
VLLLLLLPLAVPVPLSLLPLAQLFVLLPSFPIHAAVTVLLLLLVKALAVLLLHLNYNSLDYLTALKVVCFYDLGVVLVFVKPTVHYSVLLWTLLVFLGVVFLVRVLTHYDPVLLVDVPPLVSLVVPQLNLVLV